MPTQTTPATPAIIRQNRYRSVFGSNILAKNHAPTASAPKAAREKKREVYSQVLKLQTRVIMKSTTTQKAEADVPCSLSKSAPTPAEIGRSAEKTSQRM